MSRKNDNSVIFFVYGYKDCPFYKKACRDIVSTFPNVSCKDIERGQDWENFLSKNKKLVGSHQTSPVILYETDTKAVFIGGYDKYISMKNDFIASK